MISIGALSQRTGVKVATIRYYEQAGLLAPAGRSPGNQRRYGEPAVERLRLIRRARALGFSIEAIGGLIALSADPGSPCAEASRLARAQLAQVRARIAELQRLEAELMLLSSGCEDGAISDCFVLRALSARPNGA